MEEPRDKKHLQQFLGVCNFYRRFCIMYHEFMSPFRKLLKNDAIWEWGSKYSQAFTTLKQKFINLVCLSHILPNKIFKVQTDASDHGIAEVIYQINDENDPCIISIVS